MIDDEKLNIPLIIMNELTLTNILEDIYIEIEKTNKQQEFTAVPGSDNLYKHISKKYNLDIEKVPELFSILENSHKISSFDIVKGNDKNKISLIKGYVVNDLAVIKSLVGYFEKQLMRIYSEVLNESLPVSKIKKLFPSISPDYNNTDLGRVGNIVIGLNNLEEVLTRDYAYTRDARQYSPEWKEKMLKKIIRQSNSVIYYIKDEEEKTCENATSQPGIETVKQKEKIKKEDSIKISSDDFIEKNLLLYGIELYTKICFRDYKFAIIQKVIDNCMVKNREDFLIIKSHLKVLRINSDKDLMLQRYAAYINRLEKSVNDRLK